MAKEKKIKGSGQSVGSDKTLKMSLTVIFSFISIVYVLPVFFVLLNSFKANTYVKTRTFAWPDTETFVGWANYIKGFTFGNYPFLKSVWYSVFITIASTILILLCTSMAAWFIARVNNLFCKICYY
ncbi:MAG: hypothetical protein ACI4UK_10995, partial [Floccifex sp.]